MQKLNSNKPRFNKFIVTPNLEKTKIKFNIKAGTGGIDALDILLKDD